MSQPCHARGLSSRTSTLQKVSSSWAKMSRGVSTATTLLTAGLAGARKGTRAKTKYTSVPVTMATGRVQSFRKRINKDIRSVSISYTVRHPRSGFAVLWRVLRGILACAPRYLGPRSAVSRPASGGNCLEIARKITVFWGKLFLGGKKLFMRDADFMA